MKRTSMIRLVLLMSMLAGCAAAPREVMLLEMQNAKVENVPVGVQTIERKQIFREGVRRPVEFATLLRYDPSSSTIRPEKVSTGDEVVIAGTKWSVVRIEPGTSDTRGRVLLRADDQR